MLEMGRYILLTNINGLYIIYTCGYTHVVTVVEALVIIQFNVLVVRSGYTGNVLV